MDLNPLAVELCKVALWLEAHNPGQPLNFLDHHIKCGNAIVGFVQREELDKGVPDEAFVTMPGDDKDLAASWRKANKQDRADIRQMRLAPAVQQRLEGRLTDGTSFPRCPSALPPKSNLRRSGSSRSLTALMRIGWRRLPPFPSRSSTFPRRLRMIRDS